MSAGPEIDIVTWFSRLVPSIVVLGGLIGLAFFNKRKVNDQDNKCAKHQTETDKNSDAIHAHDVKLGKGEVEIGHLHTEIQTVCGKVDKVLDKLDKMGG